MNPRPQTERQTESKATLTDNLLITHPTCQPPDDASIGQVYIAPLYY